MRKHSVRKWIHAICDLLPLLVIPIFALAVRSDNNFQPIEVNYGGGYDVTNKYQSNEVNDLDDLVVGNIYEYTEVMNLYDYGYAYNITLLSFNNFEDFVRTHINGSFVINDFDINNGCYLNIDFDTEKFEFRLYCGDTYFYSIEDIDFDFNIEDVVFIYNSSFYGVLNDSGYLPEYTNFNIYQVQYNEGVIYNDTDVGSQMVYTLYNTCDKYFNFNNVGVFQDLYNWFETNMFHGTAPMSFYIVWNVILFEFIMDLIFLTYMVFMFVIDFTECMIDRFFEKSYRGGR